MGCISGIIRTVVTVFNIACLLIGLALLILGSLAYAVIDDAASRVPGIIVAIPVVFIVVGVFVFLVSFLGCCGAMRGSKCMLMTYAIILIVILVIQLAVGITGLVQVKSNYEQFKGEINKKLLIALNNYVTDEPSRAAMDSLQITFDCCGVLGKDDYISVLGAGVYPGTCCKKANKEMCTSSDPGIQEKVGCGDKFFSTVDKYISIISIVAIVISAIELLAALLAIYLARKK